MTRTEQGCPVTLNDGKQFVAADAIALLSSVDFESVEKVLAAIRAIHQYSGIDMEELLELVNVPLQRVVLGDERFASREIAAIMVCLRIARATTDPEINDLLQLADRFRVARADLPNG